MVSVIIPNYNNQQYLSECLNSVLNQTFNEFEIIVIDDCSTDHSRKILHEFAAKDDRITVIENEVNMGVVKTRDRGIAAARYPYITTLDSDDYYRNPTKLEMEVRILEEYLERGESVMPFSDTIYVNDEGRFIKNRVTPKKLREGWIFEDLLILKCAEPRDFIFSKAHYFQTSGFDATIPIYEDWDLKLRLALLAPFVYTHHEGVAYRQTGSGLSTTSIFLHFRWKMHVFRKNVVVLENRFKRNKLFFLFRFKLLRELLGAIRNYIFTGSTGW